MTSIKIQRLFKGLSEQIVAKPISLKKKEGSLNALSVKTIVDDKLINLLTGITTWTSLELMRLERTPKRKPEPDLKTFLILINTGISYIKEKFPKDSDIYAKLYPEFQNLLTYIKTLQDKKSLSKQDIVSLNMKTHSVADIVKRTTEQYC